MYININGTRILTEGIISYAPYVIEHQNGHQEFGISVTYESTEVRISLNKDDILSGLKYIDETLTRKENILKS